MTNIAGITVTATNAIQSTVENLLPGTDFLSSSIRQVASLGNECIVAIVLLLLNKVWKLMPHVYDELIPVLSMGAGMILYPALLGWSVRNICIGFVAGAFVVGVHQAPKKIGELFERFKTGDTQQIKKSDVPASGKPIT